MVFPESNRMEVLKDIDMEWGHFLEVVSQISRTDQLIQEVIGPWSVRDLLVHITAWDIEVVKQARANGISWSLENHPYGDDQEVSRLNQRQVNEKKDLSQDQVEAEMKEAHERMLKLLIDFPDEFFVHSLSADSFILAVAMNHYRGHREDIAVWKRDILDRGI